MTRNRALRGARFAVLLLLVSLAACSSSKSSNDNDPSGSSESDAEVSSVGDAGGSSVGDAGGSSVGDAGGSSVGDAGDGPDGDADRPAPLPQVQNNGGGIMSAPEIVTVTFAPSLYTNPGLSDAATLLVDLQTFDDEIMSTQWWGTVTKDYCGATGCIGTAGIHVSISNTPPGDGTSTCDVGPTGASIQPCYTDSALGGSASLKTYLAGLLTAGMLPAPTAQTLYVFYIPKSVVINVDGSLTCGEIGGYHDSFGVASLDGGSIDVPYAIVPICDPEAVAGNVQPLTIEQTATVAASHEIVEATADPHGGEVPMGSNPYSTRQLGWYLTDPARQSWAFFAGGEIADLCVDILGLGQDRWSEGLFMYQRVWSNSAAAANEDPCVPTPAGDVYFNAGPTSVQNEQIMMSVGQSENIPIVAFSDGVMPDWLVFGSDSVNSAGNPNGILSFTPSTMLPTLANSGTEIQLGVTLVKQPPMQPGEPPGTPPFEPYLILSLSESDAGAVTAGHYWPGFMIGQ